MISSSKLILGAVATTVFWAPTTPAVFAAGKETISQSSSPQPLDPGWPREITRNGTRLVYYRPQVDEWKNFRELRARFAFTLTPKEGKSAVGIEEVLGNTVADLQKASGRKPTNRRKGSEPLVGRKSNLQMR